LKRLADVKQSRDDRAVADSLRRVVAEASDPTTNLMPALMEAVRARTTIGEIIEALEGVFGTYVEQAVI